MEFKTFSYQKPSKHVSKPFKSLKLLSIKFLNDKIKTSLSQGQVKSLVVEFKLWAIFNTPEHLKQLLTFVSVSQSINQEKLQGWVVN